MDSQPAKDPVLNDCLESETKLQYEEAFSRFCLITRLTEAVSLIENPPELCIALVNAVLDFTTAENCSIMLREPTAGNLKLVVAKGRNDRGSFYGFENHATTVFAYGEGVAGWTAEHAQLVTINDCDRDSRFVKRDSVQKGISSVICAPIVADAAVLGVINCSHPRKQKFLDTDERAVSLVAEQAGTLLKKALLIEKLRKDNAQFHDQAAEQEQRCREAEERLAKLREQIYKSEKFAALGELLAGVAHELNNRIAPVLIYSQMLHEKVENGEDKKRLGIIEDSAMSAKALMETLMNYSRPGAKVKEPANLNQTLLNTLTLSEYKLRNSGVETLLNLCPDLPPAVVNEKQIAQVFLNLINNSLSAMEGGGGQLKITSTYDNHSIRFVVSDSGPGVPPEIAGKIFDPFFTTKDSGKGTGLGLSISRKYLEEHNGNIYYDASSNSGATFVIELPLAKQAPMHGQMPADGPSDALQSETEAAARILVVDDDSTIRDVIRDILSPRYALEFATDGQEATTKIEHDPYDLLVVDYHMPGLDGKQLYEWITRNQPSLKRRIVFSTGDIFHDDIQDFIKGTGCHSLTKPFSTTDLRETISGVLES